MVNGLLYPNSQAAWEALQDFDGELEIVLNPPNEQKAEAAVKQRVQQLEPDEEDILLWRVKVRQYMTKKSTPEFTFMKERNNDIPMPMRIMYGEIVDETPKMYKMKLHGRAEKDAICCSYCGRTLTHPISRYYGIGPECGEHAYFAPMRVLQRIEDEEVLFQMADDKLREVQWEGWIPKSAIESMYEPYA
jgi:hypothetical protein